MVVTIVPPPDSPAVVGPGTQLIVTSDFIGPVQAGSSWQINIFPTVSVTLPIWRVLQPTQSKTTSTRVFLPRAGETTGFDTAATPSSDTLVRVEATLQGPTSITDTGAIDLPWDPTIGLGALIRDKTTTGGGGLTEDQALQLQQVHDASFPSINLDTTIPSETPSAPGGTVSAQLPVPIFGLIVRILSIPPELVASTADGDYFVTGLAVVRIFRGSDLFMRVPVHTSSKIVPLFTDVITAAVATVIAATWLLDMSYQVSFREGVSGTVTEMRFP